MEWLQQLLGTLFVQCPTRLVFSFQLCRKQRLHTVLIFALAQMTQHSGHNHRSKFTVTIPGKPKDPNDCLSIMWWEPTIDDFKSLGSSLVSGSGELSGSKLWSLQRLMLNMEGRIEDYKQAFPTNKLLLLLLRAMQDSFTCLNLLKTTFTEMRVGVTNFQHYYLEIDGFLDYIKSTSHVWMEQGLQQNLSQTVWALLWIFHI